MLDLERLAEALAADPRYGGRPLAPLTDKGLAAFMADWEKTGQTVL